jgi:coenzyme F420-reducing hydrogenase beta subunit
MENKLRIGIVGWWYGANYGSIITYYSLYTYLSQQLGLDAYMMTPPNRKEYPESFPQNEYLAYEFAKEHYNITDWLPVEQLYKLNEQFDAFALGSDQLWNYATGYTHFHMLSFADVIKKKLAIATSFGHNKLFFPANVQREAKQYMQRFDAISLREESGVSIAKEHFNVEAQLILDPIFLTDANDYAELAKSAANKPNGKFLLGYILDPTDEKKVALKFLADKLGLTLITVVDRQLSPVDKRESMKDYGVVDASIEEFLYLFQKAEFVLTDSFHGTCLSIINKKSFISIENIMRGTSRFQNLANMLGIGDYIVESASEILNKPELLNTIDYTAVYKRVESHKTYAREWIEGAVIPKSLPISVIENNSKNSNKYIVVPKDKCTGCAACANTCPTEALKMEPEPLFGYYKPSLDPEKCINCAKCIKVCPVLNQPRNDNTEQPTCFEFIAEDDSIVFNSSSGGFFPLLARGILKVGGAVVGVQWREDFSCAHTMIEEEKDLHKILKSKYLQSYVGDIYIKIKQKLETGISVLFSGVPCQVAGLKNYLGKEYENLYIVDLLCHYSPSARFFQEYLKEEFGEGNVESYEFRHKGNGWNADCHKVVLTDGAELIRRQKDDTYQRVFHNRTMISNVCENCRFARIPRYGDITLGDFHGIDKHDNELNPIYSKGISAVLANNEKGIRLLQSISKYASVFKEVPLEWINNNGRCFNTPKDYAPPSREKFYNAVKSAGFLIATNLALATPRKSNTKRVSTPSSGAILDHNPALFHFDFENGHFEEHYIKGRTVLFVKPGASVRGNHADLRLSSPLEKNKEYQFEMKFGINTKSQIINFHIKNSETGKFQVIATYNCNESTDELVTVVKKFYPNESNYDLFMIGASQLTGKYAHILIEYIKIFEVLV